MSLVNEDALEPLALMPFTGIVVHNGQEAAAAAETRGRILTPLEGPNNASAV